MKQGLDSLDKAKQAFTESREQHLPGCLIPDYLWDMVMPLLDEYPHSMVSRVLGISSSQIKSHLLNLKDKVIFVEAVIEQTKPVLDFKRADSTIEQSCDIIR